MQEAWTPQDLTEDRPGFVPIPHDDYIKLYQRSPGLWPVELFLIAYRRAMNKATGESETQLLVRESANGTSKWGVGTGVPVTRWALSTAEPPAGYSWSEPRVSFDARKYPEFPRDLPHSWTYDKIDISEDAFSAAPVLKDATLEDYVQLVWNALRAELAEQMRGTVMGSWESSRHAVVKRVLDRAHSRAAVQGTLRMSGLFSKRAGDGSRYVPLGQDAPDPAALARSVRIYTMFPQMPEPMPLPSTPPDELRREIVTREAAMRESGRDPNQDSHGRRYTHKSTSNVSNTIHGVYLTLDATGLPGLDACPALDLFGAKEIPRQWRSLQDLAVLDCDGAISTRDTKQTFISGFIVRELVRDGILVVA